MLRQSNRKITEMFNRLLGGPSTSRNSRCIQKAGRRLKGRTGRALSAERLEARNLFAGLSFESVISTESNWPIGKSYGYAVAADAAGNTYMGGLFEGIADFDRNVAYTGNADILQARGTGDAFLAKYSPSGQFLWARRMGGDSTTSMSDDNVVGISIDNVGSVFLTGIFAGNADFGSDLLTSTGATDSFLAKIDPNGNFMWTKHWGTAGGDSSIKVVVDTNGNASVLSNSRDVSLLGKIVSSDVRQFDADGNLSWISDIAEGRAYNSLTNDASGNLYVGGTFRGTVDLDPSPGQTIVTSSATERGSFISKISRGGTLQWATRVVADTSIDSNSIFSLSTISVGNDGTIAVLGAYQGDVRIGEVDSAFSLPSTPTRRSVFTTFDSSTGALNTVKVYDVEFSILRRLIATTDGYAAVGWTQSPGFNPTPNISLAAKGSSDVWIMTLDGQGSITWAGLVGGTSIDSAIDLAQDATGKLLVTGFSASTLFDFDPHPSRTFDVTEPGSFVLKLKPTPGTKFYVVDDASANRTFEYAVNGNAVENYSLNIGNSTPRGAASTIAGDKVWVVDANKRVYVYNNDGVLLGSWSAGSLASNATIEGITTNGTDIWLVDARQDRVFRYAGAASRLSGSQNATSNFALNSGNVSPKDLVTDGANIWVVNDSTTDRVFKYSMTGALVGSWAIATVNSAPTGITIDPSGATQSIWIVDNGTDRVYEYTDSRSRNSGSQLAAITFALAAGNTNPQGIADPPANSINVSKTIAATSGAAFEAPSDQVLSASEYPQGQVAFASRSFAVGSVSNDNALTTSKVLNSQPATLILEKGSLMTAFVAPTPRLSTSKSSSVAARDEAFSSVDLLQDEDLLDLLTTSVKSSLMRGFALGPN